MPTETKKHAITNFIFKDERMSWFWLVVRLYVGWTWLNAGWEKIHSPVWVGDKAGTALHGFVQGALAKTTGAHPDVQNWYASFLQNVVDQHAILFSYLVSYGEILVGLGLIFGLFTVAAFFGGFMNFNYLLAGTVSINPILLVLQFGILIAWKIASRIGLDRFQPIQKIRKRFFDIRS